MLAEVQRQAAESKESNETLQQENANLHQNTKTNRIRMIRGEPFEKPQRPVSYVNLLLTEIVNPLSWPKRAPSAS
jgi:hypothetical protein